MTFDDKENKDSFYHYNISTSISKPLVSQEINEVKLENTSNADEILVDNIEEDWTTRNNLNIFKKPAYMSTNPFLTNTHQIHGRYNPFFSRANSQDSLMDGIKQLNEFTNGNDFEFRNTSNISRFTKRRSLDNDCDIDETIINDPVMAAVGSSGPVKRAVSCDSVSSDTSLGPLESPLPIVTGQLCLSLRNFR